MQLRKIRALAWYFILFDFVAHERMNKNDVDKRQIHAILVTVLTTGILMWSYAILACVSIASPVPGIIGVLAALTHLLSPLLYRYTNNTFFISNVLLIAGISHQATFAFFTGGFNSTILIWFGVLPMIGGVTSGRNGALTWGVITFLVSLIYFIMFMSGFQFPDLITPTGKVWQQALLVFGWIFLSSTIVVVYSGMREHTESLLHNQGHKVDDLFRVLFHDLANPLGRISIGLTIAKKQIPNGEFSRGLEIASQASDMMLEITQNIRRMYAASKGKSNVDLTPTHLNTTVEYIKRVYAPELDKKRIEIEYNSDKNAKLQVMVEPVSFNNQVLGNIVSNAIKFSPTGGKIYINVYPANDKSIAIEVRDLGIGIPQHLIGQLFDISKKTSRPGTSGEMGTGFGMHIMKSFVEMYGGHVGVESIEAKNGALTSGTTVRLILKGQWVQ